MDIEEQLKQYAASLRQQGVSRDEAVRMVSQRRRELTASSGAQRDEGLTASQRARLLAQGALFGFGEEAEAGARALGALVPGGKSPGEAYRETLGRAREDIEQAYERRPLEALATEFAGGVAPAVATLGAGGAAATARTASMAPRALRAVQAAGRASAARPIVGGAIEGAISGAGAGEGVGGRTAGAIVGAGLGGATGGAFRLGGWGARRGFEFKENLGLQREAAERAAGARAAGIPMSVDEALSELVAERRPEIPTRAAVESIEQALLSQGIEPRKVSEFARPGQTVMELGIPVSELRALEAGMLPGAGAATPIQRVARGIAARGGEPGERIRKKVGERLIGLPERVKGELTRRVVSERSPYFQTLDNLSEVRRSNAAELYESAYQQSIPASRLSQFIRRPAQTNWFVNAYRNAQRLANMEVSAQVPGARRLPKIFEEVPTKSGGVSVRLIDGAEIPVKAADYIQRALKSETERLIRRGDLSSQEGRILDIDLERFMKKVDESVPDFANARRVYRSDSANMEAYNAAFNGGDVVVGGQDLRMRKFTEEKPEVIRRFLQSQDVSESEKQFYIEAALESLLSKAESQAEGRDLTRVILGNEAMRERARLLLGSEQNFRGFMDAVLPERGLKSLEARALGGSTTAEKQVDIAQSERAGEAVTSVLTGQPMLGARIAVGDLIDRAVRRFTQATRGQQQRATAAELLTMQPQSFEQFYKGVYEPMLTRGPSRAEITEEVTRRALGGQLSRILGREF